MSIGREIGRSGIKVSAMGLGCWAIGGPFLRLTDNGEERPMGWGEVNDRESIRAIHLAIDNGVTLFDTANNYGCGHSEEVLGKALKGRRHEVVIATKFGSICDDQGRHVGSNAEPESIRVSLEGSLRRLQSDYIDLYQFHISGYDPEKAIEVRMLMENLVSEGKIRFYGWSTDHLDRAQVFAEGRHCTAIQSTLHVFHDAPEILELVEHYDLGCLNKHPLASGTLTGKFHDEYKFPENDLRHGIDWKSERGKRRLEQVEAIREVLTSDGRSMVQGALGWIWARSERTIPIPGFKNSKQVEENVGAMAFGPLKPEQMNQIDDILERDPVLAKGRAPWKKKTA